MSAKESNATAILRSMQNDDGEFKTFEIAVKAAELSDFIEDAAGEAVDEVDESVEFEVSRVGGIVWPKW